MRNIAIKIGGYVWKIFIKYFGNNWGVTDRVAIVVQGYIFIRFPTLNQTDPCAPWVISALCEFSWEIVIFSMP